MTRQPQSARTHLHLAEEIDEHHCTAVAKDEVHDAIDLGLERLLDKGDGHDGRPVDAIRRLGRLIVRGRGGDEADSGKDEDDIEEDGYVGEESDASERANGAQEQADDEEDENDDDEAQVVIARRIVDDLRHGLGVGEQDCPAIDDELDDHEDIAERTARGAKDTSSQLAVVANGQAVAVQAQVEDGEEVAAVPGSDGEEKVEERAGSVAELAESVGCAEEGGVSG